MFAASRFASASAARVATSTVGRRALSSSHVTAFTEEEIMLKDTVKRWAEAEIKPLVRKMDSEKKMDKKIIDGLFEQGLMGIEIPSEYGGAGMSFTGAILAIEELAKVDPSVSVCCDVQNTLVNNMFRFYASEEMKQRIFPKLATDKMGCFCLTEPTSGSDAFALETKAVDLGKEGFAITGNKLYITNAGEADIFVVMANLDKSKGHRGITTFVVERGMEGLSVGGNEDKLGIRASSTCPVSFNNVVVPRENVLGEIGKGYKYAIEILNEGRIGIASQMVGIAQGAFDNTIPYLYERKQFGKSIAEFQAVQFQIAQMAVDIEAARTLTLNAARMKEGGLNFVKEAAIAKYFASQVAKSVSTTCVELMGGAGFMKDMPQEKFYRDAIIGSIYEGTSNIQLQTIAKIVSQDYKPRN